MTIAPSYGLYGYNPNYTLAESPYSRLTGQYTPISETAVPGAASYLQPMFIDIDPMIGNRGIPSYPSLISEFAMINPQIPLATSSRFYPQYQQQSYQQPYTQYQQQSYPQYQQQQYQQSYQQPYAQYQQQSYAQGQYYGMQSNSSNYNIYNNYYSQPTQRVNNRSRMMRKMSGFGQWMGGVFGNFAKNVRNAFC